MAADGSIIIDTRVDTKGFNALSNNISGLPSILKKVGSAIGAAFAVGKLTEFAKEAIELGSNLSEVQNVVDVTFKTMNENINSFAENAIFVSGLSETMAKKYSGTFGAMANAFGFTEQEAYTLATTLTTLSGDIASFYNITQDEAFTKLKSVFTGETESLKDLGVVMTQTALDAYAMEQGIGRSTAQMSEQEKVALRYRFVLDQLSDTSGDFARTSGSWANQTRILSVQFDQLKATIGQGLINALTPVIQVINTILSGLQAIANAFKQFTSLLFGSAGKISSGGVSPEFLQEVADGYDKAAGGAQNLAEGTKAAAKEAKKALAPFDELTKLANPETATSGGGAGGIGGFGTLGDLGMITVDAKMQDEISPKIQKIVDKIHELVAPLQEINLDPLRESLFRLGDSLTVLGNIVLDGLEWAWFNILVPLSKWTIEESAPAMINLLAEGFRLFASFVDPLSKGLRSIWDSLKPMFSWFGTTALKTLDSVAEHWISLTEVFVEKAPEIQGILSGLSDIFSMFWYTLEPIFTMARQIVFDVFGDIYKVISVSVSMVIDVLYGLVEFLAGFFAADWARAWGGILSILSGVWDGIVSLIDYIWTGLVNFFNQIIESINNFVNDALSFLGGIFGVSSSGSSRQSSYSPNARTAAAYSAHPSVPQLAHGAVLPANKPFLAMVGDQKNGTNIEAPLETIKQALEEVLTQTGSGGDIQINFTGDLAQLAQVLYPEIHRVDRDSARAGGW